VCVLFLFIFFIFNASENNESENCERPKNLDAHPRAPQDFPPTAPHFPHPLDFHLARLVVWSAGVDVDVAALAFYCFPFSTLIARRFPDAFPTPTSVFTFFFMNERDFLASGKNKNKPNIKTREMCKWKII